MSEEFKILEQEAPAPLTLDPFGETAQQGAMVLTKTVQSEAILDDTMLTEMEKKQVEDFSNQIDLTNSSVILQ